MTWSAPREILDVSPAFGLPGMLFVSSLIGLGPSGVREDAKDSPVEHFEGGAEQNQLVLEGAKNCISRIFTLGFFDLK